MTNTAQFDRNAFAGVKPDLDSTLAVMGARLDQYLDAFADDAALQAARSELQRLLEMLKTIRMNGVVAFCTELEIVLGELVSHPDMASALHRDVLHHAMLGLTSYLDALADGADNAALRLFAQYQELQQLRGLEMSFELDLFYPDLAVQLPQQVLGARYEGDAPSRLKVLRSQYQQGLLHLLRQEGVRHGRAQDGSRAFGGVAGGRLDCMLLDGLPPELNGRKLLGRIDLQIRAVTEGNAGEAQPILNEMLYLIV